MVGKSFRNKGKFFKKSPGSIDYMCISPYDIIPKIYLTGSKSQSRKNIDII